MEHGGTRSGAGRPKGSKVSHTLEAEAFRQYLIQEVIIKEKTPDKLEFFLFGSPTGNRTRITTLKAWCPDH